MSPAAQVAPAPTSKSWCRDFFRGLPAHACPTREAALLDAVRTGRVAPVTWVELRAERDGHTATLFVSADALRIGDERDSIRINASARTTQQIADHLGCLLPTPRICNLIWDQATVRLTPCIQTPDRWMADTSRMLEHHEAVEKKLGGRAGLVENVGKHWVLTNRLRGSRDKAANYGWYDPRGLYRVGKYRVWQPVALAHNLEHSDYSQVVRLVQRRCVVDGAERDLAEVMVDPALAPLVSDEGPLCLTRLPGVPEP